MPSVLGEDEHPPVASTSGMVPFGACPKGGSSGQRCSRIQSMRWRSLASGRCRVFSAISCIRSRRACSRRQRASAAGSRGASASAAAVAASISVASSASSSSGVQLGALVVGVGRPGEERAPVQSLAFAASRRRAPSPTAARPCARWTFRLRAKASMEESSRCWRPTTSRPAAACARRVVRGEALLARRAVLVEEPGEHQLGRVVGKAVDRRPARPRASGSRPGRRGCLP